MVLNWGWCIHWRVQVEWDQCLVLSLLRTLISNVSNLLIVEAWAPSCSLRVRLLSYGSCVFVFVGTSFADAWDEMLLLEV